MQYDACALNLTFFYGVPLAMSCFSCVSRSLHRYCLQLSLSGLLQLRVNCSERTHSFPI